jgi:fructosamine-3-kinase
MIDAVLKTLGFGTPDKRASLAGGCINSVERLSFADGRSLVLKTHPRPPEVLHCADAFLLLEDLGAGNRKSDFWPDFGRKLAQLHQRHGTDFGFSADNFLGASPQDNSWCGDGFAFFADHRLRFQAEMARRKGLVDQAFMQRVDRLAQRLPELVPEQPASLVHGDLWSGNAHCDSDGNPAILDPACHYGWAETDLAMTRLFGGFPPAFYRAYEEVRPEVRGWEQRADLYNLYHIINHLNLFGGGYGAQADAILRAFD